MHICMSPCIDNCMQRDMASRENIRLWCGGSSDRSLMVEPMKYVLFPPVLHDWYTKGHGMCYLVCGVMHIKYPLLLIGKNNPCIGGSGFPLQL